MVLMQSNAHYSTYIWVRAFSQQTLLFLVTIVVTRTQPVAAHKHGSWAVRIWTEANTSRGQGYQHHDDTRGRPRSCVCQLFLGKRSLLLPPDRAATGLSGGPYQGIKENSRAHVCTVVVLQLFWCGAHNCIVSWGLQWAPSH